MAFSRLSAKGKGEDYSPVVPSPLNPESSYHMQMRQHARYKKITLSGGASCKPRSPTQLLMRHKAAVAFNHHVVAASKSRERQDLWDASGDLGAGKATSSHLLHVSIDGRTLRSPSKISGRSSSHSAGSGASQTSRRSSFSACAGVSIDSFVTTHSTSDEDDQDDDDDDLDSNSDVEDEEKLGLALQVDGSEFLVDFSGVTVDSIATAVMLPRRRGLSRLWATPGRALRVSAIAFFLVVLLLVRAEALFSKYFMQ